jgi:hypothetical protein
MGLALWLLGMPGVVAVVWSLVPPLAAHASLLPLPLWAMVLLSGLQTAVLLAVAVAVGVVLAPRIGLQAPAVAAWLARKPVGPALRSQALPGVLGGAMGAAWLYLLARIQPEALTSVDPSASVGLAVKLLSGGITEELRVRWGAMTLCLWLAWRLLQHGRGAPGRAALTTSVILSAALFAVGHLPAAQVLAGLLMWDVVTFVLIGNSVFGLLVGGLYARWGLESAMLAHVAAHAMSHPLL